MTFRTALLGLALTAQFGCFAAAALGGSLGDDRLQIHGLTLDETRLGGGFCETKDPADPVRQECA